MHLLQVLVDSAEALGIEQLVEYRLEGAVVREGPQCLVLLAENDMLQHRLGDPEEERDLAVDLGTAVVNRHLLVLLVASLQHLFDAFVLAFVLPFLPHVTHQSLATCYERPIIVRREGKFDLTRHLRALDDPGIHHERLASRGRRWHCPCRDELQALDDGLHYRMATVFPEPFLPQMRVRGVRKESCSIVSTP